MSSLVVLKQFNGSTVQRFITIYILISFNYTFLTHNYCQICINSTKSTLIL